MSLEVNITKLFVEAEKTLTTHSKLVKKLINIYLKNDFDRFFAHFIHLLKFSLIVGEKQPIIERVLSFIAKFSTSVKTDEKEEKNEKEPLDEDDEIDIDPFLVSLFGFLLENHEANSRAVRYRVCQLVNKLLNSMGEQASIDDDLYRKIYDTMLQRLMDKVPAVRVHAIHGLSRLQEPRNKECPVIKAYLFHLSMDPNPEVRRAVLTNIAVTIQTLPSILERTRDTLDLVRKQAYMVLAQKVHIRSFTIAQRVTIVSDGLNDRAKMVRNCVKKNMLQAWLRLVDGDILELLRCLDVEASAEGAELVLGSLFEEVPYEKLMERFSPLLKEKLIPCNELKAESSLYWKCLAKHLRAEKADEYFDMLLPDLTIFCEYLRNYMIEEAPMEEDPQDAAIRLMEKDFICQQLISLAPLFDMSDEVGRKSLGSVVRLLFLTPSVSDSCVKILCNVFTLLYAPAARIDELADVISEIRTPMTDDTQRRNEVLGAPEEDVAVTEEEQRKKKIKIAQLSVKINQLRDELEECIRSLNLEKAQSLKSTLQELEEQKARALQEGPSTMVVVPCNQNQILEEDEDLNLRDDPETLSRCLSIVCGIISKSDIETFGSTLRSLHDNLILPCLKSEDLGVRRCAVKALALNCLILKELAQQYQLLFVQISRIDVEDIQLEALRGLFDIWDLYGIEEFDSASDKNSDKDLNGKESRAKEDDNEGEGTSAHDMIALLTEMLNFESSEAKTLAAEGLCKLLLTSRIYSSKLVSLLIIMWYNPLTEDDHLLRHMLGVFFPCYASLGGSSQECLNGALLPTLHTIFNAPHRSPLNDIDVEDVVNFLVSITSPSIISKTAKEVSNAHDSLVFTMCAEILAFPNRDYVRSLIRSLPHLILTPTNFASLKQVQCLVQKITKKITEKALMNSLEKLHHSVQNMLQFAPQIKEEEVPAVSDTMADCICDSQDETLSANQSFSQRRKRILFSTQADSELMSDLDSETDRTPSKVKKSSANDTSQNKLDSETDRTPSKVKKSSANDTSQNKELFVSESNDTLVKVEVEETSQQEHQNEDVFDASLGEIELTSPGDLDKSLATSKHDISSSDMFATTEDEFGTDKDDAVFMSADEDTASEESLPVSDSSLSYKSAGSSPVLSPRKKVKTSNTSPITAKNKSKGLSRARSESCKADQQASTSTQSSDTQRDSRQSASKVGRKKTTSRRQSLRVTLNRLSVGTVKRAMKPGSRVTRSSLSSESPQSSGYSRTPRSTSKAKNKKDSNAPSSQESKSTPKSSTSSLRSTQSNLLSSRSTTTSKSKASTNASTSSSYSQSLRKSARKK